MFRVAFAGGGTGGHIYPALAIDDAIRAEYDPAGYEEIPLDAMRRTIDGINARRDASLAAGRKPATLPGYRDWCFESERAVAAEGRPRRSPPQTIG